MAVQRLLIGLLFTMAFAIPFSAQAFDVPKHFAAAQAVIDKVTGDLKGMDKMMPKHDLDAVHGLLNQAKTRLHNSKMMEHKAKGSHDHALAIAEAGAAKGYAEAADILHFEIMRMQAKGHMGGMGSMEHPQAHKKMQQQHQQMQHQHQRSGK